MNRSYLYVPGDRPDRLAKAAGAAMSAGGADALIADLEDGVAASAKDAARAAVTGFLRELSDRSGAQERPRPPEVLVRVNSDGRLGDDLSAVVAAGGSAVYLPKADAASLRAVDLLLADLEGDRRGSTAVVALVESARGVLDAEELAAHPRVRNLAIGEADLCAELGIDPSPDGRELWAVRSALVVASAAAGIDAPTGPVSTDFSDLDALRESTTALRRGGFGARSAIHPAQLPVINDVFTPTEDEVAEARRLVELFEASVARGDGACVDDRGRMVDEAVVRSARRVLGRAGHGPA